MKSIRDLLEPTTFMTPYQAPTEVCITVDTEFSIGGAFANPTANKPVGLQRVLCEVDEKEEGLGFLLDTFAAYGISATFFVEALNHCYFGDAPMQALAHRILASSQDVQLHLHPCWTTFRNPQWQTDLPRAQRSDSWVGLSADETYDLIQLGLQTFERWQLPRPIAFRTGNLQPTTAIYKAMAQLQIPLSSHIAPPIHRSPDPTFHLSGGRHWLHGVLELPVLSYIELRIGSWQRQHSFTVVATSVNEIDNLLWAARQHGISPIVILAHPFDFIKASDQQYVRIRRNRLNQDRLRHLCRFVHQHPRDFVSVSFRQGMDKWLQAQGTENPRLKVSPFGVVRRLAENSLNDLLWTY
ncbi:MAG: polysaccharide deacetylase [Deltaproteobacteria bacterium]|nr:polysaccharide deacetylase [Deltaproteobacteria bacterium]